MTWWTSLDARTTLPIDGMAGCPGAKKAVGDPCQDRRPLLICVPEQVIAQAIERWISVVGEREIVEPDLLGHVAGRGEEADQEFAEMLGPDAVEVVLPFAAGLD